jgi:hypothetical protein
LFTVVPEAVTALIATNAPQRLRATASVRSGRVIGDRLALRDVGAGTLLGTGGLLDCVGRAGALVSYSPRSPIGRRSGALDGSIEPFWGVHSDHGVPSPDQAGTPEFASFPHAIKLLASPYAAEPPLERRSGGSSAG